MGHVEAHTKEPKKRVGGRPIVYHVKLSSEERARLEAFVRRTTAPQAHVRRAKIALYADEGVGTVEIARRLSLSAQTLSLWRRRFGLAHQMGHWTPLTYAACIVAACSNCIGDT